VAGIKIGLTEAAYSDLEEIENYIGQSSARIGRNFVNKVFNKIELLYDHPKIERKVPEFDNDRIRELIQGKYRIVYRILNDEVVQILRIVHGSRLLDL